MVTRREGGGTMIIIGCAVLVISALAFFRVSVLPAIGAELSFSAAQLGTIGMFFALGRLAMDVPAGEIADRILPAHAYLGAGLLMALGSFLFAAAEAQSTILIGSFVAGLASALSNTTGMTFFSRVVSTGGRGRSMAAFSGAILVGQALGPAASGVIAAGASWQTSFAVAGSIALALALCFLALLRRRTPSKAFEDPHPPEPDTDRPDRAGSDPANGGLAPVAPRELVVLYGVSFVVFFMLGAMPQTLVPLIGDETLSLGSATIGLALGLGGLARLVGALLAGFTADRLSRKAALVPGLALSMVGVLLLVPNPGTPEWLAAIVLMSLGSTGVSVAATILGDRAGHGGIGRGFGRLRFAGDLGLLAGPLVGGALFEHVGHAAPALIVATLLAISTVASAAVVTETRPVQGDLLDF